MNSAWCWWIKMCSGGVGQVRHGMARGNTNFSTINCERVFSFPHLWRLRYSIHSLGSFVECMITDILIMRRANGTRCSTFSRSFTCVRSRALNYAHVCACVCVCVSQNIILKNCIQLYLFSVHSYFTLSFVSYDAGLIRIVWRKTVSVEVNKVAILKMTAQ